METGLAGKGVLVTGGAGGIGTAIVRRFAGEGAKVDVAAQVVVLASDELSGHLSGEVITVAGGMEGRLIPGE